MGLYGPSILGSIFWVASNKVGKGRATYFVHARYIGVAANLRSYLTKICTIIIAFIDERDALYEMDSSNNV